MENEPAHARAAAEVEAGADRQNGTRCSSETTRAQQAVHLQRQIVRPIMCVSVRWSGIPFLDRLARAGRPPGRESIARARVVCDLARSLRPSHWQARRIEQADLDKD